MAELRIPALEVQGDKNGSVYLFSVSAKKLYEVVRINRRDPDKDEGYQRALSASRVRAIARFIDAGNSIPTALLVSFETATFFDNSSGEIVIPDTEDAGWVIDGQHRLAGAHEAERDISLVVTAFVGLGLEQQIEQFVTINREAKGVPTSLYYDLLNSLPPKFSEKHVAEERCADIAKSLRTNEESVFFGRITLQAPKKGELSLSNFVRKLKPLVTPKNGKFSLYSFDEQVRIIENYFRALKAVFPKQFHRTRLLFFSTLGFGAMMNVLPTVFDLSLKNNGGFTFDDVVNTITVIEDFDFESWQYTGTGNAAENQASSDVRTELLHRFESADQQGSLRL